MRLDRGQIQEQVKQLRDQKRLGATGSIAFIEAAFDGAEGAVELAASEGRVEGAEDLSPWINPAKMTERGRLDLVAKIQAGEVGSVRFWAHVFGDGFNQNKIKVSSKQIKQAARSAGGIAVLDGHGVFGGSPASNIVGEVLRGRADAVDGETKLALAHRVAEPKAMESLARGLWRWFSVSLNADDWMMELLDDAGKVTDSWETAVDYRLSAVGEVWLTHNAFVGDPAWLGSEFLARAQGGALHKEMAAMAEEKEKEAPPVNVGGVEDELRTQLAAERAKVTELETALKAERAAHFSTVFDSAKALGKVSERERALYQFAAEAKGVEFARAQLFERGSIVPLRTVGEAPNAAPLAAGTHEKRSAAGEGVQHFGGSKEAEDAFLALGSKRKPVAAKK
jgi:hypothetical protein